MKTEREILLKRLEINRKIKSLELDIDYLLKLRNPEDLGYASQIHKLFVERGMLNGWKDALRWAMYDK